MHPNDTWLDLVFHVLAHVAGTSALPASVFDPVYVAFAERHLGPAAERTLAEDARALAALLPTHEALARAQLVAWLFRSVEEAAAHADVDVACFASDSEAAAVLARLSGSERDGVELLRCAALLEAPSHAALPASPGADEGRAALERGLRDIECVSPLLARVAVVPLRALRLRGRVRRRAAPPDAFLADIWTGLPCRDPGPDVAHAVWQAAHEATVLEVSLAAAGLLGDARIEPGIERAVEHAAVVLLAERARATGLREAHAGWYAHLGAGDPPERSALAPLAVRCLGLAADGGAVPERSRFRATRPTDAS